MCVAASTFAVTYQPCTPSSFRSTSVYVTGATDYNQSSYTRSVLPTTGGAASAEKGLFYRNCPTGSMTAISASNFAVLNGEGGEFYQPSATKPQVRKVSRPDSDDEDDLAIGEIIERSPVGNTPWIVMALLAVVYLVVKRRKVRVEE